MSQAIRHLREWKFGSYRVGVWATRVVVVVAIAGVFLPNSETINGPRRGWNLSRAQIAERLEATPQKHLILVREGPEHDVSREWVSNAADIDGAKVVWAREIPGRDLGPLLDYFHERKVWVLDADAEPPRLEPYVGGGAGLH